MSLAQGNNTPTRPRIEPGSPDPESNALTTRPVRSHISIGLINQHGINISLFLHMLAENVIFEKGTTFSLVGKLSGS